MLRSPLKKRYDLNRVFSYIKKAGGGASSMRTLAPLVSKKPDCSLRPIPLKNTY